MSIRNTGTMGSAAMALGIAVWLLSSSYMCAGADPESQPLEQNERAGRSWHSHHFGSQMLMQPQQASTSQPLEERNQQAGQQGTGQDTNRNFEDPALHDKNSLPAASEQDFMSRHFGFYNVHRFDPNFPHYGGNAYPRYPSPHVPRFGPGYRKDKYGHGYGYSCKQGDDCDEVRAANQLQARIPAAPPPHHPNSMSPFGMGGNPYQDLSPYPSMPSPFSSVPSFAPYGGQLGFGAPARFNDPHQMGPLHNGMVQPSRFYHGRYLHDQVDNSKGDPSSSTQQQKIDEKTA